MKSVYRYQTETGGPYYYKKISKKEMQAQGEQIAQKIVNRMRDVKELKNVPIFVMLYREEEQSSPVPGNFVSKAYVDKGEQRSEEHTSELQSRFDLVCRLLLDT